MYKICDLHIHSKFSGGASKNIDIFKIAYNCNIKGIQLVGTGDCIHPLWLNELKCNLIETSSGIFYTPKVPDVNFILQTEVEAIWKIRKGKFWFIPGHDAVYGKLQFED